MDKEKLKKTTDDVMQKSKVAFTKAGVATKKICKKIGFHGLNAKSSAQIQMLYVKLGKTVYEKFSEGADSVLKEDVQDFVSQIDELKKLIESNKEAIKE